MSTLYEGEQVLLIHHQKKQFVVGIVAETHPNQIGASAILSLKDVSQSDTISPLYASGFVQYEHLEGVSQSVVRTCGGSP